MFKTSTRRFSPRPSVAQDLLDRLDLLVVARVGGVDDVEEEVGVAELLERRAEGGRRGPAGRSRMKPTVSVMITSRSRGKRSRRLVGSSVAKSLSSASTAESVSALSSVDLPAFV